MSASLMVTSDWPTPASRKHLTEAIDRLVELTSALMGRTDQYVVMTGLKRIHRLPAVNSLVKPSMDIVCWKLL